MTLINGFCSNLKLIEFAFVVENKIRFSAIVAAYYNLGKLALKLFFIILPAHIERGYFGTRKNNIILLQL